MVLAHVVEKLPIKWAATAGKVTIIDAIVVPSSA
jgi:hypothetical protein